MGAPIRTILVAGGGIAAWLSAATLARGLPGVGVTVLDDAGAADDPDDVYAGARPGLRRLHARLGIDDRAMLAAVGGVVRLGQVHDGWTGSATGYFHCSGAHGASLDGIAFHQLWLAAAAAGAAAPFATYSTATMLAHAGRFVPPHAVSPPFNAYDYGWNLDPGAYRDFLRAFAVRAGVTRLDARLAEVALADGDRIDRLTLTDGRTARADLFVDCTGPAARLISTLAGGGERHDWARWLPCNRMVAGEAPAMRDLPLVDTAAADPAGWRLVAPLEHRTISVRLGAVETMAAAQPASGEDTRSVDLRQGRRLRPWIGNCVALGSAAVQIEPLGAPALDLLGTALDRLLALMPDTDFAAVELAEHNRIAARDTDLIRDFVILHYATSRRPEPFWQAVAGAEPPPTLAHRLAMFRARGKIPGREGERARLDDWVAVLFGQGIVPAHADPLAATVAPGRVAAMGEAIRRRIADIVAHAPRHRAFLAESRIEEMTVR